MNTNNFIYALSVAILDNSLILVIVMHIASLIKFVFLWDIL